MLSQRRDELLANGERAVEHEPDPALPCSRNAEGLEDRLLGFRSEALERANLVLFGCAPQILEGVDPELVE